MLFLTKSVDHEKTNRIPKMVARAYARATIFGDSFNFS
jgi:hypothetical protein